MIIRSIIEAALIVITIYAMVNETRIALWERRVVKNFLKWLEESEEKV